MKFAAAILSAFLASVSGLSVDQRLKLLEKAIPVGRKLQNGDDAAAAEIQITAYDSIQFNSCLSLTKELDDDMQQTISYSSDLLALYQSGDIVSQKSVVLFSICKTQDCSYAAEDSLYVVDLQSYMELAGYRPQKQLDYCDACEQAMDWCLYGQYQQGDDAANAAAGDDAANAAAGDDAAAAQGQNGGRFLANVGYVDCNTCAGQGCFQAAQNNQNGNNQNQITLEGMVEWVQTLSQCQDTGSYWNNLNIYASFMCNEEGNGVEIAAFLDDQCEVYTSQTNYSSLFPNDGYLSNSHGVVTYPFLNDIDCAESMEWESPENLYNGDNQQQQQQNDDGYQPEANEYCQQLLEAEILLPISNCNYNGDANNQNQNKQNDDAAYNNAFSSYTYDLTAEQADEPYEVCTVVATLQSEGSSGSKSSSAHTVYKSSSSGKVYTYSKSKSSSGGSTAGKVLGTIFGLLVAAGIAFFVYQKVVLKKKDDRKEPLVNEAMA